MKKVWIAQRRHASLGQNELLGYFGTRKKAVDAVLVAAQNDFSINQRWPELQEFDDIVVALDYTASDFVWIRAIRSDARREWGYLVSGHTVH